MCKRLNNVARDQAMAFALFIGASHTHLSCNVIIIVIFPLLFTNGSSAKAVNTTISDKEDEEHHHWSCQASLSSL